MHITTTAPALAKGDWGNAPNKQSAKSATFALLAAIPGGLLHKSLPDGSQFCDPLKTQAHHGIQTHGPRRKTIPAAARKKCQSVSLQASLHDVQAKYCTNTNSSSISVCIIRHAAEHSGNQINKRGKI